MKRFLKITFNYLSQCTLCDPGYQTGKQVKLEFFLAIPILSSIDIDFTIKYQQG